MSAGDPLLPAALAGADVLSTDAGPTVEERVMLARDVLRAAVDAGLIVPAIAYTEALARLARAEDQGDRLSLRVSEEGGKRAELEQLVHRMAEVLGTGEGAEEVLNEYRSFPW